MLRLLKFRNININLHKKNVMVLMIIHTITFLVAQSFGADINEVTKKIEEWQNSLIVIIKSLVKFGGIISLIGLAVFLYFNNDEVGAKKAKQAFAIILFATFIAWFMDIL